MTPPPTAPNTPTTPSDAPTASRAARLARTRLVIVFSAIALIPLIYAGLLTSANIDPTHNLEQVRALIVDEDTPTTTSDGTRLALGSQLEQSLTSSTSASNFAWSTADASDAAAQLESGQVYAVLTVPAEFSTSVASVGGDPASAAQAKLTIQTNDGVNLIAGSIATSIGRQIEQTLRTQVSESYLKNVYVGFTSLHDKIQTAADGARQVANGASDASNGSHDLVVGLGDLQSGSARLASGAATLADGAARVDTGAAQLDSGLGTLASGAATASAAASAVSSGASDLAAASTRALTGAQNLATATGSLASAAPTVAAGATAVDTGLQSLIADYPTLTDQQRLARLSALETQAAAVGQGAAQVSAGATGVDGGARSLVGDANAGTGLAALDAGASRLAAGTQQLAGSTASGTGVAALSSGAATLAQGAHTLATGAHGVSTGASSLSSGAASVASGSATAESGAQSLATGLGSLAQGSGTLASGLDQGVQNAPSYTTSESDALSAVAASPVQVQTARVNEVPGYGYGLAPYFMALALWVGALAFYLMSSPLRQKLVDARRPAWIIALRSYLPGAGIGLAQALLMVLVIRFGVGIDAANVPGLIGIAMLTSLTFVALNQALIALLGAPGRFIALLLIVLQLASAGGTYPIETAPAFFQAIHAALPLTWAVEAFRSLIAGGSVGVAQAVGVELLWLVVALAVTVLAAARARGFAGSRAMRRLAA